MTTGTGSGRPPDEPADEPPGMRAALDAERQATLDQVAGLERDFGSIVAASQADNADDEHDPEGATIAFERAQVSALAQQVRGHLAEIDAALDRLAAGSYGLCQQCGQPISPSRLEARPAARTCISCAAGRG